MDIHDARRIGELAAHHETLVGKLETLRAHEFFDGMDISGVRIFGEALPVSIEVEVQCAIRNAFNRHLIRQLGQVASMLRDHGVEV